MGVAKKRKLPCHLQSENKLGQSQRSQNNPNARRRTARLKKKNMWVKKFPVKVWEVFFQSQVRFNTVSEKVPEKVWEPLCVQASVCQDFFV